ncbi:hypothetical protein WJX79_007087 [Trebouxia sp. C0005]
MMLLLTQFTVVISNKSQKSQAKVTKMGEAMLVMQRQPFFLVISGLILHCRSRKLHKRRQASTATPFARLPAVDKQFFPLCGVRTKLRGQ